MSNVEKYKSTLPTLEDLFAENSVTAYKDDSLNALLSKNPPATWVKKHPFIKDYNYLPIDKVEYMLRMIFKRYRIEILDNGVSFNAVWVRVRVHFWNMMHNDWDYHDGIGAQQLQTQKGTSASDLININNGAVTMAYPIAKTIAIKDACDHFGNLFGANLNRKDVITDAPVEVDNIDELVGIAIKNIPTMTPKESEVISGIVEKYKKGVQLTNVDIQLLVKVKMRSEKAAKNDKQ